MDINDIKLAIEKKKNEAVFSLVNGANDLEKYRELQGYIRGIDAAFLVIKQWEYEESRESDD